MSDPRVLPAAETLSSTLAEIHRQIIAAEAQLGEIAANVSATAVPAEGNFVLLLTVFVLASFVGYYVVWKVTPSLHSPLMSVTNAISAVVIVGAFASAGQDMFSASKFLGFLAVFFAAMNLFGGFIVTDRMLALFNKNNKPQKGS